MHHTFWYLGCDCSGWVLVSDMVPSPVHSSLLASGGPRRASVSRHPAGVRGLQRGPGVPEVCRLLTPLLQGNPV